MLLRLVYFTLTMLWKPSDDIWHAKSGILQAGPLWCCKARRIRFTAVLVAPPNPRPQGHPWTPGTRLSSTSHLKLCVNVCDTYNIYIYYIYIYILHIYYDAYNRKLIWLFWIVYCHSEPSQNSWETPCNSSMLGQVAEASIDDLEVAHMRGFHKWGYQKVDGL